ncbi:hypothetical protein [Galbibacter sp. BG1]
MAISAETQATIDHYKAVRDLIGKEDVAQIKAFTDWFVQAHDLEKAPQFVQDAIGLFCDIFDPTGIAEQDANFTESPIFTPEND